MNGLAIFRSDKGFEKPSFITYLVFGGISLVLAFVLMFIIPKTLTGTIYKNTVVPITLAMIIYRYIDVGYGRDGWVSNVLIPSLMFILEQMVFWLFIALGFALGGYIAIYFVALVGFVFALIKSIKEGGLADGDWEVGKPHVRQASSNSYSTNRTTPSNNTPSFNPPSEYEVINLLKGISARDYRDILEYTAERVAAITYDNGFNFTIIVYYKANIVYGQEEAVNRMTDYDLDRIQKSAEENFLGRIKKKLDSRGIGYEVKFEKA